MIEVKVLRTLSAILIGCVFVSLFWPYLVWMIILLILAGAFIIFKLWKDGRIIQSSYSKNNHYSNIENQTSSDNIIDVEYTERRIEDDQ